MITPKTIGKWQQHGQQVRPAMRVERDFNQDGTETKTTLEEGQFVSSIPPFVFGHPDELLCNLEFTECKIYRSYISSNEKLQGYN